MGEAPRPLNEDERLALLERYRILDTPEEEAFDAIAALAASITGLPLALVTLVDRDRQWFKAHHGTDVRETDRSISFCAWSVHLDEPLHVTDTAADQRFADNPLVQGDAGIRFYAGIPLRTPAGPVLGTLCVLGHEPRELPAGQLDELARLAGLTVHLLESRRMQQDLTTALERVRTLGTLVPVCAYCNRIRDDEAYWNTLEHYLEVHTGAQVSHGICPDCMAQHFEDV